MTTPGRKRGYTDEEARAIFERALAAQSDAGIGHEELIAAAAEVGLSREAVERAVAEMDMVQVEREAKHAILARRRRRFRSHLVPFITINLFLFVVNWLTSPGAWWFLFPLVAWGLGLFFHAWAALTSEVSPKASRRELARSERERRQSQQRLLEEHDRAQGRERHARIEQNAKLFGEAVEEGVATLLHKLAQQLRPGEGPSGGMRVEAPKDERTRVDGDLERGIEDSPRTEPARQEPNRSRR
jgi:hypothetical protein